MKPAFKNLLNFILRFGISGALLVLLYNIIDVERTIEVIKDADYTYVFYGLLVFFLIHILITIRWYIFIKALHLKVPLFQVIRYSLVGFFGNLFLPSAIGGDIIKIAGMCHHCPEREKVVGSILLDRISGYAGIIIVATTTFVLGYSLIDDPALIGGIILIVPGFCVVMALMFSKRVNDFFCRLLKKFPKAVASMQQFYKDMQLMKGNHRYGLICIGMGCLGQILLAVCFFFIAKSLHQEAAFVYFLIFVPFICVAASVPSIAGLGVREAATAYLFSRIGVEAGIGASLSLMIFAYMIVVGLLGGLYYVLTLSAGRVQHPASDSEVSESGVGGPASESY